MYYFNIFYLHSISVKMLIICLRELVNYNFWGGGGVVYLVLSYISAKSIKNKII